MSRRSSELSSNYFYWTFVAALAVCTVFFAANVERRRAELRTSRGIEIDSGTIVSLVRVMDADELAVRTEAGEVFVVRLLGVKGFPTTANEPGVAGLGQLAVTALERELTDKQVQVVFEKLELDSSGRVLAYLDAEGQDVALPLLERGHLVTYTRYPFTREAVYQGAEAEARTKRAGLWGNSKAAERVKGWKVTWQAAREAEGGTP